MQKLAAAHLLSGSASTFARNRLQIVVTAGKNLAAPAQEAAASQAGLKLGYQTFTTDVLAAPAASRASISHRSPGNGDDT